jgi:hypothetical protein
LAGGFRFRSLSPPRRKGWVCVLGSPNVFVVLCVDGSSLPLGCLFCKSPAFWFWFFFSFFVFMFLCFLFDRMRVVLDLCDVVGSLGCKGLFVLLSRKGLVVD